MYKILYEYPNDLGADWTDELNGVCHDSRNWYFSGGPKKDHESVASAQYIYKIPVTRDLKSGPIQKGKRTGAGHFGDIDYWNGKIFVPVSKNTRSVGQNGVCSAPSCVIEIWDAETLTFDRAAWIQRPDGQFFSDIGWLAINPRDGLLYTTDGSIRTDQGIFVYKINTSALRKGSDEPLFIYWAELRLKDESGRPMSRGSMQGGCFDNENHLHLTNGYFRLGQKTDYSEGTKGGISVYKLPDMLGISGNLIYVRRIINSHQTGPFSMNFEGQREEPEGITYWDLSTVDAPKGSGRLSGVLHAIVLDNDSTSKDDLFFNHYEKAALYEVTVKTGGKTGAGTDADVYISFCDSNGVYSPERIVESSANDHEKNDCRTYSIAMPKRYGDIPRIRIRHNNKGSGAGWYLNWVIVEDMYTHKRWQYNCYKWLAKDEGDKKIDRILERTHFLN